MEIIKNILLRIKELTKKEIFTGGAVMLIGTNLANAFAYLYHLVFGRLLGPSGYSDFANFISVLAIIHSAFAFINIPIIRFATSTENYNKEKTFAIIKKISNFAVVFFAIVFATTRLWSNYFSMDIILAYLVIPNVFMLYLIVVFGAFMQAELKFKNVVIANNTGWLLRLVVGVAAFILGYGIFGIFVVYFFASIVTITILKKPIKNIKSVAVDKEFTLKFIKYSLPSLLMFFSFSSFITIDIILVKKFFPSFDAGLYSSLSALGKIVFYGTVPVSAAIFPMVAKRSHVNAKTSKYFLFGMMTTIAISSVVLVLYKLFPETIINLMFGEKYLGASNLLFVFGIFSALFSINYLYINYFMSKNIMLPTLFPVVSALFQIIGILFFHENLLQVIMVSITASLIQLFLYLIYTLLRMRKLHFSYN